MASREVKEHCEDSMAGSTPPGKPMQRLFAAGIAAVVLVTVGVAVSGIVREMGHGAGRGEASSSAAKAPASAGGASTSAPNAAAAPQSTPKSPSSPASGFAVKRVLKIEGPLHHGDYVWDDKGVPNGPIVITVDLKAQTLSVFRDGYEIGVAVILYGANDKPSPLGIFPVMQKDADYYSRTYDNAPMPYALRLTDDGVFIHGSDVVWGNATHGCIGVPTAFAKKLFGVTKLGDPVIVTNGKMMPLG